MVPGGPAAEDRNLAATTVTIVLAPTVVQQGPGVARPDPGAPGRMDIRFISLISLTGCNRISVRQALGDQQIFLLFSPVH